MIEICALGSLRVTAALWNAGCLASDGSAKIIMITSQGGSIAWRPVQNAPGPDFGGDYGSCDVVPFLVVQVPKYEATDTQLNDSIC